MAGRAVAGDGVSEVGSRLTGLRSRLGRPGRSTWPGPGVEVARGDVRDPASIAGALRGAATIISAVHGFAGPGRVSPASVDRAGNAHLIDAAASTGAAFVLGVESLSAN
jgi:uncharacterized protein YbjT (DUF2867 family)